MMKQSEFIGLSAASMTLTALGIDIMLPAFAALREHFGLNTNDTAAAQIISFFFMGQISQLLFGVLSDRYGRIKILRIGFPLYIAGGIGAAFAPTLEWMFVARFIAGMGASAVFMSTIAGVRDRFKGDQMARIMSLILSIFLFTPILAPFIGVGILQFFGWQAVFITPPFFAILVFIWSFRLKESLDQSHRVSLSFSSIASSARSVLTNFTFLRYTLITTVLFMVFSSYIASSELIIGEIYHHPELFIWIFAGIGVLLSICSYFNSRLTVRFGARRTLHVLLLAYTLVAMVLLIVTFLYGDPPAMWVFFVLVALLVALNVTIEPNSSALALEPMGAHAGMAASIYGTSFFFLGASVGAFISDMIGQSLWPMIIGFVVCSVISTFLAFSDRLGGQNATVD